ncbi:MAG: hypothetical protein U0575_02005 [Phycisphaerales bacterium]
MFVRPVVAIAAAAALATTGLSLADAPCAIPSTSVFLEPQMPDPSATFGSAVAVNGDWIAVGVPGKDATTAGRVEVFHRVAEVWSPAGILMPIASALDDRFGVALSMQGDTLLVGAERAAGAAATSGVAYIFRLTDGRWQEEATLLAEDGQPLDHFGWDVALDGDHALVGALGRDDFGSSSGAAYLFKRAGTQWALEATLLAPDAAEGDQFGYSVEMDSGIIAIGAIADDDAESLLAGSVRIFELDRWGWTQTANLNAAESLYRTANPFFGMVMALRGGTLLVTAKIGSSTSGTLLAYERVGDGWTEPRLVIAPSGLTSGRQSLTLAPTGDVAVWGARNPSPSGSTTTAAAILHRDAAGWYVERQVAPPAPVSAASGATSAAFDGQTMVVGRTSVTMGGVPKGVVFVADLPPRDVDQDGLDDACEIASGLSEDCDDDGIIDDAQVPHRHVADNVEDAFLPTLLIIYGPWQGGVMIVNHFVVTGSDDAALRSIAFVVPNLAIGGNPTDPIEQAIMVVYSDPNGDGNPADAELLFAQAITFPPAPGFGIFTDFPIGPVEVGPPGTSFFAGFAMEMHAGQVFTQADDVLPHRQAGWLAISTGPLDLADLSLNPFETIEQVEDDIMTGWALPIRVNLTDCDGSKRLDSCEIARGELVDLDGDLIPDICEPTIGDLDGNGVIDGADVGLLLGAWGACPVPPTRCAADINGDGAVDGADLGVLLQTWTG